MFKENLTPEQITDIAAVSFLVTAPKEANLIKNLFDEMSRIWDTMVDQNGKHLIQRVVGDGVKSDGVKDYAEKLSVLVFNSIGSFQRGLSKTTISDKNEEAMAIIRRVPAYPDLTNERLFKIFMINLFGYDSTLVSMALASSVQLKSDLLIRYVLNRFDIAGDKVESEELVKGFYPTDFFDVVENNQSTVFQECFDYIVNQQFSFVKALRYYSSSIS